MSKQNTILAGVLTFALAVAAMACMNAAAKYLSDWHHPVEITFYRDVGGLVLVTALIAGRRRFDLFQTERPLAHIRRGIIGNLAIIFAFIGFSLLPLADIIVLIFTSPLFVALFSGLILGERVGWKSWAAILIGFTGVLIVAQPTGASSLIGLAAGLASGLCSGLTNLFLRDLGRNEGILRTMFYFLLTGTGMTGLAMPFIGSWPDPRLMPVLAGIGVLGFIIQFLKTKAFSLAPAARIAPVLYTLLLWGALFDFVIWDHAPAPAIWVGGAVIIAANLLLLERRKVPKYFA